MPMQTVIPESILRAYLLTRPAVTALVGVGAAARIYALVTLPAGYNPATSGRAIQLNSRPGAFQYDRVLTLSSIQARFWSSTELDAWNLYIAATKEIEEARTGQIQYAWAEGPGTALVDPETKWPFILAYYSCNIRNPVS